SRAADVQRLELESGRAQGVEDGVAHYRQELAAVGRGVVQRAVEGDRRAGERGVFAQRGRAVIFLGRGAADGRRVDEGRAADVQRLELEGAAHHVVEDGVAHYRQELAAVGRGVVQRAVEGDRRAGERGVFAQRGRAVIFLGRGAADGRRVDEGRAADVQRLELEGAAHQIGRA